jgi:hypothetical protein
MNESMYGYVVDKLELVSSVSEKRVVRTDREKTIMKLVLLDQNYRYWCEHRVFKVDTYVGR